MKSDVTKVFRVGRFALSVSVGISAAIVLAGCSGKSGVDVPLPKSKTATGALTGAAVGGGLGLLIGSTSGEAGQGLLVGSLAGGAVGAGIGAKLQKDEEGKTTNQQDTLVQQNEKIKTQSTEIEDLKKSPSDDVQSFYDAPIRQPVLDPGKELPARGSKTAASTATARKNGARARLGSGAVLSAPSGGKKGIPYSAQAASANSVAAKTPTKPLRAEVPASVKKTPAKATAEVDSFAMGEATLPSVTKTAPSADVTKKAVAAASGLPPAASQVEETAKAATSEAATAVTASTAAKENAPKDLGNCKDALKEAERGLQAASDADRLFYLRRAARLCPTEPSYHVELGKLYSTIGKAEDAKYELRQAIDLDPNNQVARDELSIIENTGGAQ